MRNNSVKSFDKKNGEQRGKTSLWGLISFPMTTSKTTSKNLDQCIRRCGLKKFLI